uniref:Neur_chan_LBD domain-containing protein n=1 Tax=Panagrellus redivivus TaxID=6233 RepID=A0A7E4ZRK6_PANRE
MPSLTGLASPLAPVAGRRRSFIVGILLVFVMVAINTTTVSASDDEERLMVDIFKGYNSLIQPIKNLNDTPIIVRMALQLVLLINVDEKDQIMHTNVWLTLKWKDFQMAWNPTNYGNVKEIRVAPDKVWLPDIVLFNNADGNYEVSFMCNVVINHRGDMLWVPPAIYKSSCIIDVEFFPFDEQTCHLIFGSWTYNENEIKLEFEQAEWIDLSEYSTSSIWDVMDAPASLVNKRSRIEFQLRIRRKTLFYTVVLIIPTVLMAFLSMAVFFLPTDSGEKMTLTISVLLSIVVFLLLVSKILPPTSSTIPLMAKYLLLTFVLNVITILVTVIIINIYFRGPTTHRMPKWVHTTFLTVMPKLLCMQRPKAVTRKDLKKKVPPKNGMMTLPGVGHFTVNPAHHHPLCPSSEQPNNPPAIELTHSERARMDSSTSSFYPLSAEAVSAIDAIEYITDHLKQDEEYKMYRDDWKYVAMIIDRLLLYIFFGITAGGTIGILFSAPYVFDSVDQKTVLTRLIQLYKSGGEL